MTRGMSYPMVLLLGAQAALGQAANLNRAVALRAARGFGAPGTGNIHEPFAPPMTAAKIRAAIDDAVMFLRSRQGQDGSIASSHRDGGTALAALAMLAAGANPASDQQLRKALDWLAKREVNNTYVRAICANVWEYALRKVPHDKRLRALLKRDYDWLLKALGNREGWRYSLQASDWDNSCTQYGVLGVWAAARAGLDPGEKFWQTMSKHFRSCQNPDGGWGYVRGGSTANMATAGLASMFLVFDMYHGKSCYSAANPRTFIEGEAAAVLKSIERGMAWLGKAGGGKENSYYLYGIERTGVASGRKYFGGEDWFRRGAMAILRRQGRNGAMVMGYGDVVSTSFCTLCLVYGGAPVAFNKLQYGTGHDWNLNPRDLANLSKHLWGAYERPLNWQTVSIAAAPEEFEAPILFISGSKAARFSEEEMLKLREYVLRGGTILAEPSDRSGEFAESMEALVRRMFDRKDFPACELKPLPADHGVYSVIRQDWDKRPRLKGVSDGSRTFFFLSGEYLSADWQMNRTDSDAFKLAMNLLFYATDLGELTGKYASDLPDTPPVRAKAEPVTVARVKYAGRGDRPRDWDAACMCWRKFAPYVKHVTGRELKEAPPVALGTDIPDGIGLLHLTGRGELALSGGEREALKKFVAAGGTVLVDAYAGSTGFAASARKQLEAVFGPLAPLPADDVLAQGRFEGGCDLARGIRFTLPGRRLLRRRGESPSGQKLLVARAAGRAAVIFSEFDLSAAMAGIANYRALGHEPTSARKVVGNVLAYATVD